MTIDAVLMCCVLLAASVGIQRCESKGIVETTTARELSRCYDCDYAPDDGVTSSNQGHHHSEKKKKSWDDGTGGREAPRATAAGGGSNRGFPQCALDQSADQQLYVRDVICESSVCFIRKDDNGLLYRGCADRRNLPLGVDPNVQCQQQGLRPAVWWFCNGSLCNGGRFGVGSVCAPPTPAPAPPKMDKEVAIKPTRVKSKFTQQPSSQAQEPSSGRVDLAPGSSSSRGLTFEQIQQRAGYANAGQPVEYGGTGLTSEQSFQVYMANHQHHQASFGSSAVAPAPIQSQPLALADPNTEEAGGSRKSSETEENAPVDDPKFAAVGKKSAAQQPPSLDAHHAPPQVAVFVYSDKSSKQPAMKEKYPKKSADVIPVTIAPTTTTTTTTVAPTTAPAASPRQKTWDFVLLAKSRLQQLSNDPKTKQPKQIAQPEPAKYADVHSHHADKSSEFYFSQEKFSPFQQQIDPKLPENVHVDPVVLGGKPDFYVVESDKSDDDAAVDVDEGVKSWEHHDHHGPFHEHHIVVPADDGFKAADGGSSSINPCDGSCRDNPSGLFADDSSPDAFIQCASGPDPASGAACHCCRPVRMRCPSGTSFDRVTRVCSGGNSWNGAQQLQP